MREIIIFEGFENGRVITVNRAYTDKVLTSHVQYTLKEDGVIAVYDKGTKNEYIDRMIANTAISTPESLTLIFDVDDLIDGKFILTQMFFKNSVVVSKFDFGTKTINNLAFNHNEMSLNDAMKFVKNTIPQLKI